MLLMQATGYPPVARAAPAATADNLQALLDSIRQLSAPAGRMPSIARVAEAAARLTGQRADILRQLLRATCAPIEAADSPFRPIWVFENVTRARLTIRLLAALDRLRKNASPHMLSLEMERDAADRLSAGLLLLRDLSTARPVPCSAALRHVARDLVELFGPTIGEISIATQIEPVSMPNIRRRALVLAACNLLLQALAEAFSERRSGTLLVSLRRVGATHMRLTVADDGSTSSRDWTRASWEAVEDLSAVLEGRLVQRRDGRGGAITELTLPL